MRHLLTTILIVLSLAGVSLGADELRLDYPTGATIVAAVTNSSGQWWDTAGGAFETYNTLTDYDIAATDAGGGVYLATMPALAAGTYTIKWFSGTTHIATTENFNWSGSAKLYSPVDVQTVEGDAVSDGNDISDAVQVGMTAQGYTTAAAANFQTVFVTDFATNYDTTKNQWAVTLDSVSLGDVWSVPYTDHINDTDTMGYLMQYLLSLSTVQPNGYIP